MHEKQRKSRFRSVPANHGPRWPTNGMAIAAKPLNEGPLKRTPVDGKTVGSRVDGIRAQTRQLGILGR